MGCFCSLCKAEELRNEMETNGSTTEFVNKDEQVKDTSSLLQPSEVQAIAIDDSSSSSPVNQEMIQKLLDEIDDLTE